MPGSENTDEELVRPNRRPLSSNDDDDDDDDDDDSDLETSSLSEIQEQSLGSSDLPEDDEDDKKHPSRERLQQQREKVSEASASNSENIITDDDDDDDDKEKDKQPLQRPKPPPLSSSEFDSDEEKDSVHQEIKEASSEQIKRAVLSDIIDTDDEDDESTKQESSAQKVSFRKPMSDSTFDDTSDDTKSSHGKHQRKEIKAAAEELAKRLAEEQRQEEEKEVKRLEAIAKLAEEEAKQLREQEEAREAQRKKEEEEKEATKNKLEQEAALIKKSDDEESEVSSEEEQRRAEAAARAERELQETADILPPALKAIQRAVQAQAKEQTSDKHSSVETDPLTDEESSITVPPEKPTNQTVDVKRKRIGFDFPPEHNSSADNTPPGELRSNPQNRISVSSPWELSPFTPAAQPAGFIADDEDEQYDYEYTQPPDVVNVAPVPLDPEILTELPRSLNPEMSDSSKASKTSLPSPGVPVLRTPPHPRRKLKIPNRAPTRSQLLKYNAQNPPEKEKHSPKAMKPVRMTRAHMLRVNEQKRKGYLVDCANQEILQQAEDVTKRRSSVEGARSRSAPAKRPVAVADTITSIDVEENQLIIADKPSSDKATQVFTSRKPTSSSGGVRLPRSVSPAGRFSKNHGSGVIRAGHNATISRISNNVIQHSSHTSPLKVSQSEQLLIDSVKQKEVAREGRKEILDDLNNFLSLYAGDSPQAKKQPEKDEQAEWERKRIIGKVLFTKAKTAAETEYQNSQRQKELKAKTGSVPRSRGQNSPRFTESENMTASHQYQLQQHSSELKSESWKEAVRTFKKHSQRPPEVPVGDRLFKDGVVTLRERRKWADSEKTKQLTKHALEEESHATFAPQITQRSRTVEASLRRGIEKDSRTRLVSDHIPSQEVKRIIPTRTSFGRTTRVEEVAKIRSTSAPVVQIPDRVNKLAQPKQSHKLIEDVATAMNNAKTTWIRDQPVDARLLAKRDHEKDGQNISQYLYGDSIEKARKRTNDDEEFKGRTKEEANVGNYINQPSREMAIKRRRERLDQLFTLLDLEGNGIVSKKDVEQANQALRSVKTSTIDERERSVVEALTEAAEILRHETCESFTRSQFISQLEGKIGRSGPLRFMTPEYNKVHKKHNVDPSFNPRISEKSREIARVKVDPEQRQIHNRLYHDASDLQQKAEVREERRKRIELAGATFQPQINKGSLKYGRKSSGYTGAYLQQQSSAIVNTPTVDNSHHQILEEELPEQRQPVEKPRRESRRETRQRVVAEDPPVTRSDDVVTQIETIVGNAATWLKEYSIPLHRRAKSKSARSLSVSPPTPLLDEMQQVEERHRNRQSHQPPAFYDPYFGRPHSSEKQSLPTTHRISPPRKSVSPPPKPYQNQHRYREVC